MLGQSSAHLHGPECVIIFKHLVLLDLMLVKGARLLPLQTGVLYLYRGWAQPESTSAKYPNTVSRAAVVYELYGLYFSGRGKLFS